MTHVWAPCLTTPALTLPHPLTSLLPCPLTPSPSLALSLPYSLALVAQGCLLHCNHDSCLEPHSRERQGNPPPPLSTTVTTTVTTTTTTTVPIELFESIMGSWHACSHVALAVPPLWSPTWHACMPPRGACMLSCGIRGPPTLVTYMACMHAPTWCLYALSGHLHDMHAHPHACGSCGRMHSSIWPVCSHAWSPALLHVTCVFPCLVTCSPPCGRMHSSM